MDCGLAMLVECGCCGFCGVLNRTIKMRYLLYVLSVFV